MKKLTLAAASALTLALAVPMIASAHGHKGGGHSEKLDTNADGTIAVPYSLPTIATEKTADTSW